LDHHARVDEDTIIITIAITITAAVLGVVTKMVMVNVGGEEVRAVDPGTVEQHILRILGGQVTPVQCLTVVQASNLDTVY
jgi:hypothetical protein